MNRHHPSSRDGRSSCSARRLLLPGRHDDDEGAQGHVAHVELGQGREPVVLVVVCGCVGWLVCVWKACGFHWWRGMTRMYVCIYTLKHDGCIQHIPPSYIHIDIHPSKHPSTYALDDGPEHPQHTCTQTRCIHTQTHTYIYAQPTYIYTYICPNDQWKYALETLDDDGPEHPQRHERAAHRRHPHPRLLETLRLMDM